MARQEIRITKEVDVNKMAGRLARFYGGNLDLVKGKIEVIVESDPYISQQELFRKLADGAGRGKPHKSRVWGTYMEGEPIKEGKIKLGRKSGRYRLGG